MRQSYVQTKIDGKWVLIPKDQYVPEKRQAPMIMPDISPYQSMITGEMIGSRSHHRNHLKQHNCIEVGNEKPDLTPKEIPEVPGRKDAIMRSMYQHGLLK